MALGTNHVTKATADKFIPELWSDEIVAAYKNSLVLANVVNKMPMKGKKGDTIHIPKPTRGTASAKAASTQVTLQAATESEVIVTIDKHYEYSRLIEDIVETQAQASLRKFYTDDAGYALAKQVDTDLFAEATANFTKYYVDGSNGLAAYVADTVAATDLFSDLALRDAIQLLDDEDVPMDNRVLVVPPSAVNTIRGIDRYMSSDFGGAGTIKGQIGTLYGIPVLVSTNCPVLETAAQNANGGVDVKAAVLMHKDAIVFAEQMGVRSQTQYKQEYLSTLFTSDTLYGVETLRSESGIILALPA
jgi:N4-gp56 family major capsid protein